MKLPGISARAAREIDLMLRDHLPEDAHRYVATVAWCYVTPELDCPRTLVIGAHEAIKVPPGIVGHAHGISLAFWLSEGDLIAYADHVLDYFEGSFFFVPSRLSQFVGSGDA